ncbi:hypothetical protein RXV86_16840 [Alisedimentitalea sp. MJ-SS2]|uniref:hypothetical protein n=1 Tax=Aliisedimentitalea sp. MJ-SS2 TaxID=3049795 RepID=UPI00290D2B4A|nr:hypothetical protein [Alisedimentitalea sp. MJ-SS2]MDU8929063.1 hypothetical protein [Alisedimentitalea sp. MJ-SS2]
MAKGYSLADQLFNAEKVAYLGELVSEAAPGFDAPGFSRDVMARLHDLELKARINWIAECLDLALPGPFDALAAVIAAALPAPCDPALRDDDFGDFIFAPLGELVVRRGMETPDRALDVLEEVTQRFSMEYAIRPFLNAHEDLVLDRLGKWCDHEHYHVRRLVSEGTRPRLPWGIAIAMDPDRALPLLDRLYDDDTRFVTRSVANHLNDLSKLMPGTVMQRLACWDQAGRQAVDELGWMRKHALRTLVKQGEPKALAMLGYLADAPVRLTDLSLTGVPVAMGDQMRFAVTLEADEESPVLVDYVLYFHRGDDGPPRRKVMKLGQAVVRLDRPLRLEKHYRMPRGASTVKVLPGPHRIEIQVNGRVLGGADFDVLD